jgi:hypothetical protein
MCVHLYAARFSLSFWAARLLGCGLFWGLFYFVLIECYPTSLSVFLPPSTKLLFETVESRGDSAEKERGLSVGGRGGGRLAQVVGLLRPLTENVWVVGRSVG